MQIKKYRKNFNQNNIKKKQKLCLYPPNAKIS